MGFIPACVRLSRAYLTVYVRLKINAILIVGFWLVVRGQCRTSLCTWGFVTFMGINQVPRGIKRSSDKYQLPVLTHSCPGHERSHPHLQPQDLGLCLMCPTAMQSQDLVPFLSSTVRCLFLRTLPSPRKGSKSEETQMAKRSGWHLVSALPEPQRNCPHPGVKGQKNSVSHSHPW